jgi:hypothetical protein
MQLIEQPWPGSSGRADLTAEGRTEREDGLAVINDG